MHVHKLVVLASLNAVAIAADASAAFNKVYATKLWAGKNKHPSSGAGSTLKATTTTCAVLKRAVVMRRARARRFNTGVKILDTPCGDWTWMPSCLQKIASEARVSLIYQGVDVVESVVTKLNARVAGAGGLPTPPPQHPPAAELNVTVLPFQVADVGNLTRMSDFANHFDVIISKHMLIHTPNEFIFSVLRSWNAIGAAFLVTDNWPYPNPSLLSQPVNTNIDFGQYREMNLHAAPFQLSAPLCTTVDHAMCDEVPGYRNGAPKGGCRPTIGIFRFPLAWADPAAVAGSPQPAGPSQLVKLPDCLKQMHLLL